MKEQILKVPFTKKIKDNLKGLGLASQLVIDTFVCIIKGQINIKNTIIQMVEVGYMSFPIVLLTSFFVGMVLALQVGSATANLFNEPVYIGMITGYSLVICSSSRYLSIHHRLILLIGCYYFIRVFS